MGNLFIGFPVPRAKIATMIETAAPPLEHVENHEPDGTDPIVLPGDISTDQILQWNGTKFLGTDPPAEGVPEHYANHEPDGSDPIVLPDDITTDQLLKWNGTKFIGTDEPAGAPSLSPISIHPSAFLALDDEKDYYCDTLYLRRRSSTSAGKFYAPLFIPHGVTVTKMTVYAYRDHANAWLTTRLYRISNTSSADTMAEVAANWTNGNGSRYDDSISNPITNNNLYSYCIYSSIDPFNSVTNVKLIRVQIDFE